MRYGVILLAVSEQCTFIRFCPRQEDDCAFALVITTIANLYKAPKPKMLHRNVDRGK